MHLGQHQLQILGSVVVILAAAVVALICDFLKRNNDQLRKLTAELKVRHEEELRRAYQMTGKPAPPGQVHAAVKKEKQRPVNSEALAAMERGAALAGAVNRPRSEFAAVSSRVGRERHRGSLLGRNTPKAAPDPLPVGFQDRFVLTKLVQSRQAISGLVVSIGVHASRKSHGKLPESVGKLIQSLIGPQDFAAQSSEDEFLLIFPQERDAGAQRRLSQISDQLWNFQLRSLVLFSWGAVEVRGESIEEALASASQRMQEIKRSRKLQAVESSESQQCEADSPPARLATLVAAMRERRLSLRRDGGSFQRP